jgi:hypothetical protein
LNRQGQSSIRGIVIFQIKNFLNVCEICSEFRGESPASSSMKPRIGPLVPAIPRFGSLTRAYSLIGWTPDRDYAYIEINRGLRRKQVDLIASILDQLLGLGATVSVNQHNDLLTVNSEYTASLILARCRETHAGNHRWHLRFDESLSPDIVLVARLQPGNEEILDYYLLPRLDVLTERLSLRPDNGLIMDVYRFNNLNFFMEMAQRVRMEGTA